MKSVVAGLAYDTAERKRPLHDIHTHANGGKHLISTWLGKHVDQYYDIYIWLAIILLLLIMKLI